jgi:hypothetical protein
MKKTKHEDYESTTDIKLEKKESYETWAKSINQERYLLHVFLASQARPLGTEKARRKMAKDFLEEQRKDMLKKYEGKLEGEFDHLKEGVDYLDDIQRRKRVER